MSEQGTDKLNKLEIEAAPEMGFGLLKFTLGEESVFLKWNDSFAGSEKNTNLRTTLCKEFGLPVFTFIDSYNRMLAGLPELDPKYTYATEQNKHYCDLFGPKVNRYANSVFIKNYFYTQPKSIQNMAVTNRGGRLVSNMSILEAAVKNMPLVLQAEKDGLGNIVPLIARMGKSPQELKSYFGKGLWKRISHQSYAANKRLSQYLALRKRFNKKSPFPDIEIALVVEFLACKAYMQDFIISRLMESVEEYLQPSLIAHLREQISSKKGLEALYRSNQIISVYMDACNLAEGMYKRDGKERAVPAITSFNRIKKWHDELIIENNKAVLESMSLKAFVKLAGVPDTFNFNGYRFTRLKDERDLFLEGRTMRHCIHGYTERSMDGTTVCYSIEHATKRASVSYSLLNKKVTLLDARTYFDALIDEETEQACQALRLHLYESKAHNKKNHITNSEAC